MERFSLPLPPSSFALFFSETRFRALGDLGLGDSNVHGAAKEKGISSVPQNFLALAVVLPPGNRYTCTSACQFVARAQRKTRRKWERNCVRNRTSIFVGKLPWSFWRGAVYLARRRNKSPPMSSVLPGKSQGKMFATVLVSIASDKNKSIACIKMY